MVGGCDGGKVKFKRKKSKRSVKCTICTSWRWLGNSKQRLRISELKNRIKSKQEIDGLD